MIYCAFMRFVKFTLSCTTTTISILLERDELRRRRRRRRGSLICAALPPSSWRANNLYTYISQNELNHKHYLQYKLQFISLYTLMRYEQLSIRYIYRAIGNRELCVCVIKMLYFSLYEDKYIYCYFCKRYSRGVISRDDAAHELTGKEIIFYSYFSISIMDMVQYGSR